MANYTTLGSNLKRSILRFSEKLSKGLTRPDFKFISQMIYGLLSSQSCHLSKIARTLDEQISLKKTIDRLSRNLNGFTDGQKLLINYMRSIKKCFSVRSILIIDDSDITKPCSSKLEGLGVVRDGSTGSYGMGYHTIGVTALTPGKKQPVGVYTRVYSASEKDFVSADEETLKALRYLSRHFKKSNVRAFDRGYDANIYYKYLIGNEENFIIRAKKNRDVTYKGERLNILTLASRFKGKYSLKFKKKNGIDADCKISIVPIRLPCRPEDDLSLVICRGIGKEPLMLITGMKSDDPRLSVTVTKVYLMRWRIEEFYGFKKQQFDFEDFRVRSLNSIRNLDLLLTIAIGFIGLMSEKCDERETAMELIAISKRIYATPKFTFYALADGMFTVFARCKQGIWLMLRKKPKDPQLSLFTDIGFAWG
jgi:hypothetical protein